jgi:hypothetical protein
MAKKKISGLPAGSALNGTELVPIVQAGTTKRITAQDIANLGNASGVEGSGTINYLAKFTATSTIGNSLIFDNGTGVGIGTTTPTALLQVKGVNPANPSTRYLKTQIGGGNIWGLNAFEELAVGFNGIRSIFSGGDNWDISFTAGTSTTWSSGTQPERMRITATGNVGIGTTSPTQKLSVLGNTDLGNEATNVTAGGYTTRISGASLLSGALYYGSYGNLILNSNAEYTASSRRFLFTNALDGTKFAIVRSASATTDPSFAADGVLSSGIADFVINNTGSIGMGATAPVASAKLQIDSTSQGVLVPRMTTTQINAIGSPANGLIAYNTTLAVLCFYDGTGWKKVSHSNM